MQDSLQTVWHKVRDRLGNGCWKKNCGQILGLLLQGHVLRPVDSIAEEMA